MATSGRTHWLAKDSGWWRRERIVRLGLEFGAAGPAIIDWLSCEAKAQNDGGWVKTGYAALSRGAFVDEEVARNAVSRSVTLGLLDEHDVTGDLFMCRISGWKSDQEKAHAADRQADYRARKAANSEEPDAVSNGSSRSVTKCPPTGQDRTEELHVEPTRLDEARGRLQAEHVQAVFDEWVKATGRTGRTVLDDKRKRLIRNALKTYPLDDLLAAVRGWRHSPHHRGENDRHTVFNDLGLLLRDGEHIEKFRDIERQHTSPADSAQDRQDRLAALNAAQLGGDAA